MVVCYLKALVAIAVALSILMMGPWMVQQRTGNSGWVDTIWTFSLGLVGAGSAVAGAAYVTDEAKKKKKRRFKAVTAWQDDALEANAHTAHGKHVGLMLDFGDTREVVLKAGVSLSAPRSMAQRAGRSARMGFQRRRRKCKKDMERAARPLCR